MEPYTEIKTSGLILELSEQQYPAKCGHMQSQIIYSHMLRYNMWPQAATGNKYENCARKACQLQALLFLLNFLSE